MESNGKVLRLDVKNYVNVYLFSKPDIHCLFITTGLQPRKDLDLISVHSA